MSEIKLDLIEILSTYFLSIVRLTAQRVQITDNNFILSNNSDKVTECTEHFIIRLFILFYMTNWTYTHHVHIYVCIYVCVCMRVIFSLASYTRIWICDYSSDQGNIPLISLTYGSIKSGQSSQINILFPY